jgi:replicative DNA helicase
MVLPGPTSSGKSALCAQFAIAYAKQGMRVLYVPLEMSARQVIKRAISAESGHSAESVRNMVMNRRDLRGISRDDKEVDAAMQSFSDSAFALANLDITVIDDVFDLDAILSTARAHASTKPLDVLCVDYPALMQMKGNYERRQLALAHASRSFKQFASEINGLVITPSQVNKDGCTREAADFENDANAIVRVDFHEDDETCRVVKIAKQRDGARGQELRLSWRGHTTSFISYQSQP